MTGFEIRENLHRQIDQLLPDQLNLLSDFLDFLQFKKAKPQVHNSETIKRKPGLHPGAFVVADDFDDPLPDSFWLGEK